MLSDFRFALRTFRRTPALIAAAVLAIAFGVGANTAIFSMIQAVLIKPLPYLRPDRLVMVWEKNPVFTGILAERIPVASRNFTEWRRQASSFSGMEAASMSTVDLTGTDKPEELRRATVTTGFFALFGRSVALGRVFAPEDAKARVVVLSYAFWRRRFNRDAGVLGRRLSLAGETCTVIGVLPEDFHLPATFQGMDQERPDIWVPMTAEPLDDAASFANRDFYVYARLRDGVSLEHARSEMTAVSKRLETQYPDGNKGFSSSVWPLKVEDTSEETRAMVIALQVAVGFVLLIACANVANLLLARSAGRGREMAVRAAMGASRGRLVRQAFTETLTLSAFGGTLGLALADLAMRGIDAFAPRDSYHLHEIGVDWTVLAFAGGVALLSGFLFGIAPALSVGAGNLRDALAQDGRAGLGRKARRLRSALIVGEVAASVILLAGAGLMIRSLAAVMRVTPGFDPEHVLTAHLRLPDHRYPKPESVKSFCDALLDRLAASPGVESASISTGLPMADSLNVRSFQIDGDRRPKALETDVKQVSEDYFRAAGAPILRGRGFTRQEASEDAKVLVANEAFARRVFPNADPLGRAILFGDDVRRVIVGVVPDSHELGLEEDARPELFSPTRALTGIALMARTKGDPMTFSKTLAAAVSAIDKDQTVVDVKPLAEHLRSTTDERRFNTLLLGGLACLALLLAAVGLYGVLSYSVVLQRREIGVRMALGAQGGEVLRMVLRNGMALTLLGVAIGGAGALVLTRLMQDLIFRVSPTDPITFASVPVALVAVALLACYVPARRAAAVDPAQSLRGD
jgi:predicted permease